MARKVEKPGQLEWVEPTYLGLVWDTYNALPEPHREIPFDEYVWLQHFSVSCLLGVNYRQVRVPDWPWTAPAHFQFYTSYGLAVTTMHVSYRGLSRYQLVSNDDAICVYDEQTDTRIPGYVVVYKPRMYYLLLRYWRLGCEHPNLQRTQLRMHEYRMACPECGWAATYDSSG